MRLKRPDIPVRILHDTAKAGLFSFRMKGVKPGTEFTEILLTFGQDKLNLILRQFASDFCRKLIPAVRGAGRSEISFRPSVIKSSRALAVAYIVKLSNERSRHAVRNFSVQNIKSLPVCARDDRDIIDALHSSLDFHRVDSGGLHVSKMIYHAQILA